MPPGCQKAAIPLAGSPLQQPDQAYEVTLPPARCYPLFVDRLQSAGLLQGQFPFRHGFQCQAQILALVCR